MDKRNEIAWIVPPVEPGAVGGRGMWRVRSPYLPNETRRGRYWEKSSRSEETANRLLAGRKAQMAAYEAELQAAEEQGEELPDIPGDATFAVVAREWHNHQVEAAAWGSSQAATQRSLLETWLLSETILVPENSKINAPKIPLADIPVAQLVPNHIDHALQHVYEARARGTYLKVRQQVRTILEWAVANRRCPAQTAGARYVGVKPRRQFQASTESVVPRSRIPEEEQVSRLAEQAEAVTGLWWRKLEIQLLARCGMRIGELLGIRNFEENFRWSDDGDVLWLNLVEQWNLSDLKSRKPRWTPVPKSLGDQVQRRREEVAAGDHLFCSPEGHAYSPSNWRRRVFDPAAEAAGLPERGDYRSAKSKEPAGSRPTQSQRRWRYPPHSLRHFAVTYLLRRGLDAESVALIVGHTNGEQLRRMYKHRPPEAEDEINNIFRDL